MKIILTVAALVTLSTQVANAENFTTIEAGRPVKLAIQDLPDDAANPIVFSGNQTTSKKVSSKARRAKIIRKRSKVL